MAVTLEPYACADDLAGDDQADAARTFNAAWDEWVPGERPVSTAAFADQDRNVPDGTARHCVLARGAAGRLVGWGEVQWNRRPAEGACTAHVLVAPEAKGTGVGTAIGRHLVDRAREGGRWGVTFETAAEGAGARWCERAGLRADLLVEINRTLAHEVSDELLADWIAAGEAVPGYSLVAFDDRCPDDLVEAAVVARLAMNDAPMYEGHPDDELDVEELRGAEAASVAANQEWWGLAIRHDASGEVAGLTDLFLPRRRPWIAFQGDTCVVAAHRGHGLGAWMKAVNLRRLRTERPDVELVSTWNAASNEPMLRINRALGFTPAGLFRGYYLPFD